MEVIKIVTGTLEANCYVLKQNGTCLVIDPGADGAKIKDAIGKDKVLAVLLTHTHVDHIGAIRDVIGKKKIPTLKGRIAIEQEYHYGTFTFDVIKTKGHSSDSITFYFKDINTMFTGDFLFKEDIGRCDLPTGSTTEMMESIEKIKKYDPNIIVRPGHGEDTTLGHEFEKNSSF